MEPLVILVDLDHTLLDGDAVRAAITAAVEAAAGRSAVEVFWSHYPQVRLELDGVDIPETARRTELESGLEAGSLLPAIERADFAACLHAGAIEALAHLNQLGCTVVLTDGDPRFQRLKIAGSGVEVAVDGRVLVVPHKERALDLVTTAYPARHYALIDDRVAILGAIKAQLGDRVTTVRVLQGRYAGEKLAHGRGALPSPDLEIPVIEAALRLDAEVLLGGRRGISRP